MDERGEDYITFDSGAVRSKTSTRYDLISPIGLRAVAEACAEGAERYGDFNHEYGMPVAVLLNHALAHINEFLAGDRTEPHLGHASWNLLAACHSFELYPELNAKTLRGPGCTPPPKPSEDLNEPTKRAPAWDGDPIINLGDDGEFIFMDGQLHKVPKLPAIRGSVKAQNGFHPTYEPT